MIVSQFTNFIFQFTDYTITLNNNAQLSSTLSIYRDNDTVFLGLSLSFLNSRVSFNLPVEIIGVLLPFADIFSKRVWNHIQTLLVGSILATGKRTVTSILEY